MTYIPELLEEVELTLAEIQATFSEADWEVFESVAIATEEDDLPF